MKKIENEIRKVSLREVFKKLDLGIQFNDWIESKILNDLVTIRKFPIAKTPRFQKDGKINGYDFDKLISNEEAKLIFVHYSKEVKKDLISQDSQVKSITNKDIVKKAFQILMDENFELKEKLLIVEPKAKLLEAREKNNYNLIGFRDTFKRLQTEFGDDSFWGEIPFKEWLYENGIIFKNKLIATKPSIDNGYCKMVAVAFNADQSRITSQLKFTEKGYNHIFKTLKEQMKNERIITITHGLNCFCSERDKREKIDCFGKRMEKKNG